MDIIIENKISPLIFHLASALSNIPHIHKELELIYVKKGRAMATAGKNRYVLEPGDIFLSFPNQIHYYNTLENGEYIILIFSPEIIYGLKNTLSSSVPTENYIPAAMAKETHEVFEKIKLSCEPYRMVEVAGLLNVLMSKILPNFELKDVNIDNNSALHSVLDYCSRYYNTDITLDTVSENLHLSKYYISHLINKNLKQNFNEYINNLRIAEACNYLNESEIKISDISENVGFGTIRSFNRAFKQIIGISPAEYRIKMITNNKNKRQPPY